MMLMRGVAAVYFAVFTIMVTWPGFTLFNRVTPFILGLPFNLFFLACLILGGMIVLWLLHGAEERAEARSRDRADGAR